MSMLLVEKRRILEQNFDSNVIITAFEEDKLAVTEIMTELNIIGVNYVFLEKGQNVQNDYWYWRAAEENLKKASCLIMVMSKAVFDDENTLRRESFWYEAGVMESRGQSIIPYILDIDKSEIDNYFHTTPIRQMQVTTNVETLISKIEQTRVFKKSFFSDRDVAFYGNSRVFYSRISVLFHIKREVLDKTLERLRILDDDEINDRGDILRLFQREINFGATLHRFGKKHLTEHPYYFAYEAESEILNIDCNAVNTDNRFSILSNNLNGEYCAIKVDFILPNHEILGAALKPYMEINKNSVIRKSDLVNILRNESSEEIFENKLDVNVVSTEKTQRVYFNLYFEDDIILTECSDEKIGKTCNFVYPK